MDKEYALVYRDLYERHWWWRAREALLLETVEDLCSGNSARRILDVGCGSGLFFDKLLQFGAVEGVESDPDLASAEARHRERIFCGDFLSFEPHRKFHLILMLDVLEHLPDASAAVERALELLEPTGSMVITVPAFMQLWTNHDVLNHHQIRYTRESFHELVVNAGGQVNRSHYFFHWTFGAKLAVRMVEAVTGPRGAEKVPPPMLNRLLYRTARFEQRFLTPLNLPFGTSLLAICSK